MPTIQAAHVTTNSTVKPATKRRTSRRRNFAPVANSAVNTRYVVAQDASGCQAAYPAPAGANSLLQANSSVRFVHSHGRGRAIQPTRSRPSSDTKLAAKIASPIHTDHQSSVLNMPLCQRRFVVMRTTLRGGKRSV